MMSQKSSAGPLKSILLIVFTIFFVLTAFLAGFSWKVWMDRSNRQIPSFFGYQVSALSDSSMEPQFSEGSAIFFESDQEYHVQDVVVCGLLQKNNDGFAVKRVIEVKKDGDTISQYLLKGDAEKQSQWVIPDQMLGKVSGAVPFAGNLLNLIETREGLVYLILIPCGVFFVLEIVFLVLIFLSRKKKPKKEEEETILPNDRDENFVDVTDRFVGKSQAKLQGFLAEEVEARDASEEKFAKLDYNPLFDKRKQFSASEQSSKEGKIDRVTLNTKMAQSIGNSVKESSANQRMKMVIGGVEVAEIPLMPVSNFKIKSSGYTVDVSITPDDSRK
ncbi:MAG: hypothetical protein RR977_00295 [Oscillospiraceae bacterium]